MKWLLILSLLISPISTRALEPEAELLALQRIADFWEDGELAIARTQMIDFLAKFPQSSNREVVATALGDLFLREGDFSSALEWYSKVNNPSPETQAKRFRCLYQMGWYSTLIDEATPLRDRSKEITQLLALSLYQQSLNDPLKQHELALQAKPLFTELLAAEHTEELAHALAHIHMLLEDLAGASAVYEQLAETHPERDYLLQAALLEAKFAPEKAVDRLAQVLEQKSSPEAAYWWLALSAKLGHHEQVIQKSATILPLVDEKLKGSALIFVGTSYRALSQNEKAAEMFRQGLEAGGEGDFRRIAMLALAEASYLGDDLPSLEKTIAQLQGENPNDPTLPFWFVSKARVLERLGHLEDALSALAPLQSEIAQTERIRLEIKAGHTAVARQIALALPNQHRLLLQTSEALSRESVEGKQLFIQDLAAALKHASPSQEEAKSWRLLAAITSYELKELDQAAEWIAPVADATFPDAELVLALCKNDTSLAEKALRDGATLIKPALQHMALFNAYRETSPQKAAEHLFEALDEPMQEQNLHWLSEFAEKNFSADKREKIAAHICSGKEFNPSLEKPFLELAKAQLDLGKVDDAKKLFEQMTEAYRTDGDWNHVSETIWCFAKLLKQQNLTEQAETLLDELLASTSSRRDYFLAAAALDSARMKNDPLEAAPLLRDLILQKHLPHEPIHLEAALDTVDRLGTDTEKKISLLMKMRKEFTEEEDLLSKDYHAARRSSVEQNRLFENYLQFIDAELLLLDGEKELQAKGKDLLIQIRENSPPPPLQRRVESLLNRLDAHDRASD